ncbi:helix-turn-helix transcriptional regulator [Plantactinospora sp. S1510]|uniref:Helix-turn-helix transcriptional regulator n=1 Tax=Plantactinospora alkalitolerans TaxID=2789879 RepID=A0ABS0GZH1_9ACTN|nr:LuxR family transcriptional regulator [Plantactinospora alkalitolerans]MBF9131597.1 helix-turn-helix transcriptional regulator [Plantactinospora alkalitolerans]
MPTSFTLDRSDGPAADGSPVSSVTERWILRTVAICEGACEIWFLERMTDRAGPELHDDVEMLIVRNVLADSIDGLRFSSAELRDDVLRATPPSLRSALHARAAAVLAAELFPGPAANQLLRAMAVTGRVDVPLVSRLVADPATEPSVAADLLLAARAGRGAALGPQLRRDWVLATVDHLILAGRLQPALTILTEEIAADRDGAGHRAQLLGRLGAWYAIGRPSVAIDYLHQALAQSDLEPAHRSLLLTTLAHVAARVGHPDVDEFLAAAVRSQAAAGAPDGEVRLALAEAGVALAGGDVPAARQVLDRVDPSAPAARAHAAFLRVDRIVNQLVLGEYEEAGTAIRIADAEIGSLGAAARPMLTACDCRLRVAIGELPEASARAGLALRRCPTGQVSDEVRAELLAVLVEVSFRQGDPGAARKLLAGVDPPADWPENLHWVRLACAAALDPEPDRHAGLLRVAVDTLARSVRPLLLVPQQAPALTRAALLLGDRHRAHLVSGYVTRVAERVDRPLWWGIAQHVAGLVDREPGLVRDAVAELRATSARPALADALLDLARMPATPAAVARKAAEEGAALFGRLGATGDQERADRCGRAGPALDRRHRHERTAAGFDALTAAEVRVAELLAGGATKQQAAAALFVSFHTVDSQLRAVYAKLGIRNRLELARRWRTRTPDQDPG